MVLFGVVRANGAVLWPLAILFIAMFPIRIGFATAMQPVLGVDALWLAFPVGSIATLIMAAAYYRFGNWRKLSMVVPREETPVAPPASIAEPATSHASAA